MYRQDGSANRDVFDILADSTSRADRRLARYDVANTLGDETQLTAKERFCSVLFRSAMGRGEKDRYSSRDDRGSKQGGGRDRERADRGYGKDRKDDERDGSGGGGGRDRDRGRERDRDSGRKRGRHSSNSRERESMRDGDRREREGGSKRKVSLTSCCYLRVAHR